MEHYFNHKAALPNPALSQLFRLILGEWETIGLLPLLPNLVLHRHSPTAIFAHLFEYG